MIIKSILQQLNKQFQRCSFTPRLDAELLIAHTLNKPRAYIYSHAEDSMDSDTQKTLAALAKRLIKGEPIAYLLEKKEFYSLEFTVNKDVLIPRPETECLVEWALAHLPKDQPLQIADLGTGSGVIAISLAKHRPNWHITATDISEKTLHIAKQNAQQHQVDNIEFHQGSWCHALPKKAFDAIISNPPYIAKNDPHLKALNHEPKCALISGKYGLDDIAQIITQAPNFLCANGMLILEHGYHQQLDIQLLLNSAKFINIKTHNDLAEIPRFVTAETPHHE